MAEYFYTIAEISKQLNVPESTIRSWRDKYIDFFLLFSRVQNEPLISYRHHDLTFYFHTVCPDNNLLLVTLSSGAPADWSKSPFCYMRNKSASAYKHHAAICGWSKIQSEAAKMRIC